MAPLDTALPLPERGDPTPVVSENLDLDVARPLEVFLDVDAAIPERLLGLPPRGLERPLDLGVTADQAHSLPAAPRRRLEHDGITKSLRFFAGLDRIAQRR